MPRIGKNGAHNPVFLESTYYMSTVLWWVLRLLANSHY